MVVSAGKLLGSEIRHNDNLAMFFLKSRLPHRYGGIKEVDLKPGHPVYERIKAEVLKKSEQDDAAVFASIDEFLEGMRQRRLANEAILLGTNGTSPKKRTVRPTTRDEDAKKGWRGNHTPPLSSLRG